MSQSIDLSTTATTACTFNSSTVEKINLNGTEIWTKPSSGPTYVPTTGSYIPPSSANKVLVYPANSTTRMFMYNGKLYTGYGGISHSGRWFWCNYGCNWTSGTFSSGYALGSEITSNFPTYLYRQYNMSGTGVNDYSYKLV